MSRYIDVDIAKNLILNDMALAEREGKDLIGYTDALFHLKTIPIADVVEVDKIFDELVEGIADMLPNKIYNIESMNISEATSFGETNALRKVLCLVAEVKKRYESEEL